MIARYKSRPLVPVDAVQWDGTNIEEIQTICPEVQIYGTMLVIPSEVGPAEAYVSNVIMKEVGINKWNVLNDDVFHALYMPQ
jgi:hypothetical protein